MSKTFTCILPFLNTMSRLYRFKLNHLNISFKILIELLIFKWVSNFKGLSKSNANTFLKTYGMCHFVSYIPVFLIDYSSPSYQVASTKTWQNLKGSRTSVSPNKSNSFEIDKAENMLFFCGCRVYQGYFFVEMVLAIIIRHYAKNC